jgi:hypothetical protein
MRDREPALHFAHSFPRHCMSHPPTKKSEKSSSSRRAPRALVSIVAVELGATFPAWISSRAHSGEFRVVAAREAETGAAFAERVISVMKGLFADGTAASGLVIVCNERIDDGALAARKSLIAGARTTSDSKLSATLAASARSSARLREALHRLAHDVSGTVKVDQEQTSRPRSSLASVANVA